MNKLLIIENQIKLKFTMLIIWCIIISERIHQAQAAVHKAKKTVHKPKTPKVVRNFKGLNFPKYLNIII